MVERLLGPGAHRRHVHRRAHVGVSRDRASARTADLFYNRLRPLGDDVGDDDGRALGGESLRDDAPDAGAPTRDDGRSAGEPRAHPFSAPSWSPRMYHRCVNAKMSRPGRIPTM